MKVYRLDNSIDNEKMDFKFAIGRKKEKKKLPQFLKRRKYIAVQMNDKLYSKERIESISIQI